MLRFVSVRRQSAYTADGPRAGACRLRRFGGQETGENVGRSPKRDSQGSGPLSGCGPAVPAASAAGDVFTHPSPTSRGLGCFVSFLSGGRARTRRTADEQGPSACGVLGDGRRGDERRSPKRDSQGSGPLSGRGQSPPFSRRDGWGMRRRWEGWKAGILQGMESWAWARAGCSQRKAGAGRRAL